MADSPASSSVAPIVRRAVDHLALAALLWLLLVAVVWLLWWLDVTRPPALDGDNAIEAPGSHTWAFAVLFALVAANAVFRGLLVLVLRRPGNAPAASEPPATAPRPDLIVCCSGGGIKSASFCLGALQRLDEGGLYERAEQLVGVSGGGYAATAFSLAPRRPGAAAGGIFGVGSHALSGLRQRTNYLADSLGTVTQFLLSLGFGITVNLIAALTLGYVWVRLLAQWVAAAGHVSDPYSPTWSLAIEWDWQRLVAPIGVPVGIAVLTFLVFLGDRLSWPRDNRWSSRAARGFWSELPPRLVTLGWCWALAFPVLVLVAGQVRHLDLGDLTPGSLPGWLAWLVSSGLLVAALRWVGTSLTAPTPKGFWGAVVTQVRTTILPRLLILLGGAAAYVGAAVALAAALSSAPGSWWYLDASLAVAVTILLCFRFIGSANLTSMYPFYRDRLAWAFLYQECRDVPDHQRDGTSGCPHGHAWSDCHERIPPSRLSFESLQTDGRPELVLCATANVLYDPLPSGRQASSFILSTSRTGLSDAASAAEGMDGFLLPLSELRELALPPWRRRSGALPARHKGRVARSVRSLDLLGSAMAISGAAISPVAGRDSRQVGPFRTLLTLANIRLGVWQPSPGWLLAERYCQCPRWLWRVNRMFNQATPAHVLAEATGRLGLGDPNLYLTDGGHYDNLGLVEALRSKPRRVIVLDGSGDPLDEFPTMGRAIATARMDLGVEIAFDPEPLLTGRGERPPAATAVQATATWGTSEECRIDYVRAVLPRDVTWDLRAYAGARRGTFPDSSDTLEVYDEFDFEAFRQLGYLAAADPRLRAY